MSATMVAAPQPRAGCAGTLFPFFVERLSGLPVEAVEPLQASEELTSLLDELVQAELESRLAGAITSEKLFARIGATEDRGARRKLLRLRRDLHNLRQPSAEDVALASGLLGEGSIDLARYCTSFLRRQALTRELENAFARRLRASEMAALELAEDPDFERGLLLSSPPLYSALRSSRAGNRRRRERLHGALLRYLVRAAMKATPFGRFCAVVPGRIHSGTSTRFVLSGDPMRKDSRIRLDLRLAAHLVAVLVRTPGVRDTLPVELNPTLALDGDAVVLLTMQDGREVFQRVGAIPVLRLIEEVVREQGSLPFGRLAEVLARDARLEATPEEARDYLEKLTEIGMLRFRLGLHDHDAEWDERLRQLLAGNADLAASAVRTLLERLRAAALEYGTAPADRRVELTAECERAIGETLVLLGYPRNAFRGLVFREDAGAAATATLSAADDLLTVAQTLLSFVRGTLLLSALRTDQAALRQFYDAHYGASVESVTLLKFYEDYYRHLAALTPEADGAEGRADAWADPPLIARIDAARASLKAMIAKQWAAAPDAEEFNIESNAFCEVLRSLPPLPTTLATSVSIFGEIVPQGARPTRFCLRRGYGPGFGKLFSRFLYLLPAEMSDALRRYNDAFGPEYLAEISGSNYHNANLHPPLLPWVVCYPTGEATGSSGELQPMDIVVQRHPRDDLSLCLIHAPTGAQVLPIDLGFQALEGRPPLYRLLVAFSPISESGLPLPEDPDEAAPPGAEEAQDTAGEAPGARIICRPRITFGGCLVLSRRQWRVPVGALPTPEAAESRCSYFARLAAWRREVGIPREVYLRVQASALGGKRSGPDARVETRPAREALGLEESEVEAGALPESVTSPAGNAVLTALKPGREGRPAPAAASRLFLNLRKPQYLDLDSPIFVELFKDVLRRAPGGTLVFEERYPAADDLPQCGGLHYASEQIFQLDVPALDEGPIP